MSTKLNAEELAADASDARSLEQPVYETQVEISSKAITNPTHSNE